VSDPVVTARAMFDAALRSVSAGAFLPPLLPGASEGPLTLFALGKAAAAMADIACRHADIARGLVVTRTGHVPPGVTLPPHVRLIEADHPVPGETGLAAAHEAMALARSLGPEDHLLALVSGGGSALLPLPAPGVTLADKRAITRSLLRAGASIGEINTVRQALSAIKGGRLGEAASTAWITTILLSDVPGDDPALIASGPTVAPAARREDARAILHRYGIAIPPGVDGALARPPCDWQPDPVRHRTVTGATADRALDAAAQVAGKAGYRPVLLGSALGGSAKALAERHARLALNAARAGEAVALISGGEAEVAVPADAPPGGRNLAFLAELALALAGAPGIAALACDTDGIDGTSCFAGGLIDTAGMVAMAWRRDDVEAMLRRGSALTAIEYFGQPIETGPTCTNVNDFRCLLIEGRPA
jgi:glycerate 2-kinase